jgi:hypothetical protein
VRFHTIRLTPKGTRDRQVARRAGFRPRDVACPLSLIARVRAAAQSMRAVGVSERYARYAPREPHKREKARRDQANMSRFGGYSPQNVTRTRQREELFHVIGAIALARAHRQLGALAMRRDRAPRSGRDVPKRPPLTHVWMRECRLI